MKSTTNLVDGYAGWPAHVMKLLADGFATKIARGARAMGRWGGAIVASPAE
jgi:hypothetical protein